MGRHQYDKSPLWKFYKDHKITAEDRFKSLIMMYSRLAGDPNKLDPWADSEPPIYANISTLELQNIPKKMPDALEDKCRYCGIEWEEQMTLEEKKLHLCRHLHG